jgi:hypothetical protein
MPVLPVHPTRENFDPGARRSLPGSPVLFFNCTSRKLSSRYGTPPSAAWRGTFRTCDWKIGPAIREESFVPHIDLALGLIRRHRAYQSISRKISVAPMMDWSDDHCRKILSGAPEALGHMRMDSVRTGWCWDGRFRYGPRLAPRCRRILGQRQRRGSSSTGADPSTARPAPRRRRR